MANRCGGSAGERKVGKAERLVKNVKKQAGSRAALTACLFTPGMEGDFANEEFMIISWANEEENTRDQRY